MMFDVHFLFHRSLNDFLSPKRRGQWALQSLKSAPSVKDAIEACGVPHVEVAKILVNKTEQDFSYRLRPNNGVEVFPYENPLPAEVPKSFVLDVHLGKLARLLRMLGIDALYENHLQDKEIVTLATAGSRVVLTRDIGVLKHKVLRYGYWLRSQQPGEQLREVVQRFSLCHHLRPFSRCMGCNGLLMKTPKENIRHLLPPLAREIFHEFYQCANCHQVYWKGSHFEKMQGLIDRIRSLACN